MQHSAADGVVPVMTSRMCGQDSEEDASSIASAVLRPESVSSRSCEGWNLSHSISPQPSTLTVSELMGHHAVPVGCASLRTIPDDQQVCVARGYNQDSCRHWRTARSLLPCNSVHDDVACPAVSSAAALADGRSVFIKSGRDPFVHGKPCTRRRRWWQQKRILMQEAAFWTRLFRCWEFEMRRRRHAHSTCR
jgi:hypothetical protein